MSCIRGCGRCGEGGSSPRGGGASRRLGLVHAHDTSTCALSALTTCATCAFCIDSGSDALPVTGLRTRRGRVVHCRGWRSQQGIGTARSPAPLRQGVEVGGAAPGAGAGGWCEKTTKKPWQGGEYVCRAMCVSCVGGARISPCSFPRRLAVRGPWEGHTVRRFSRGGLSSPVCRRCGCGISYLLTYLDTGFTTHMSCTIGSTYERVAPVGHN